MRAAAAALAAATALSPAARAETLHVGPDEVLKAPSDAARLVHDGDRVLISPGAYADCAVWRASRLTIEGAGADPGAVVIADAACQGKGLFVTVGDGIKVRNLTLARAAVPDRNGAGIRAEGADLTVDRVRFVDDENGVLAGDAPGSTITVRDSVFERDGKCDPVCAHGVYVGRIALLRVERTRFAGTREGHSVKSRAARTEVVGCDIADGEDGTSSYLIEAPNGGSLIVRDNTLEKGPQTGNPHAAISIGAEGGLHRTEEIVVANNAFANESGLPTTFVVNRTKTPAQIGGNRFTGPVDALEGPGSVD